MLRFAFTLALAAGLAPAAQVASGGYVVGARPAVLRGVNAQGQVLDSRMLLQNGGFESGSIQPWVTTKWVLDSGYPHSGTYCACDVGNYSIMQWVDTTPGSEVQSVTFWARQPQARSAPYWLGGFNTPSASGSVPTTHRPPCRCAIPAIASPWVSMKPR